MTICVMKSFCGSASQARIIEPPVTVSPLILEGFPFKVVKENKGEVAVLLEVSAELAR